ncbi:hypothetical protein ACTFIR_009728 [Dictyostelium discoideum]
MEESQLFKDAKRKYKDKNYSIALHFFFLNNENYSYIGTIINKNKKLVLEKIDLVRIFEGIKMVPIEDILKEFLLLDISISNNEIYLIKSKTKIRINEELIKESAIFNEDIIRITEEINILFEIKNY